MAGCGLRDVPSKMVFKNLIVPRSVGGVAGVYLLAERLRQRLQHVLHQAKVRNSTVAGRVVG
jgi:hypothetical protein